jgi:hypothetical protein
MGEGMIQRVQQAIRKVRERREADPGMWYTLSSTLI